MKVLKFYTPDQVATRAAKALDTIFMEALQHNQPILLFLSGGTALNVLDHLSPAFFSETMTITMLDDRFSTESTINHFITFKESDLYLVLKPKKVQFITTFPEFAESVVDTAVRIESDIRAWRTNNPTGKMVAILGVGPDGHTAGIAPMPENPEHFTQMFKSPRWYVGYDAGNKLIYPQRVTATITFLKEALDIGIFYMTGDVKKEALKRIQAHTGDVADTPARVAHFMKDARIMTDIDTSK